MIVNFFSPDGRYDDIYLSNFATIYVKDELLRVDGVSDINYLGQRDYSIRAWLDPQKLASRNMTAIDVANAIRSQNVDAPAGQIGQPPAARGQPFQLPVDTLGRLSDSGAVRTIIVKAGRAAPEEPAPASSASATWPASSWAPRTTTSRAPSTATRRSASPSTSSPAPTPSTSPTASAPRWRSSRRAFPDGVDYDIAYDTTPFIRESVSEVFKTLLRRGDPGRPRRAGLPAGLAGHDPADDRRAGLHHRHLRRHGGAGLQPEQPDAVRPGAGHRHRGRRRHRGAGERRAA